MNTRTKVYVDRLIGLPLGWLLNGVARILGKVLRRDHSITTQNVRTIVIAKYVGMGSIIQVTPLIRTLRVNFPQSRIIFLTGHSCRRLVERLEHIDAILTVDDRNLWHVARTSVRTLFVLMREKVDLFFDLEVYSAYASIMALLSLTRNRIGFYRESAEHKKGIYSHLIYFTTRSPIRYVYLQQGRAVGCEPVFPDRLSSIRVERTDREEAAAELGALGVRPGDYLVVNANASDLMIERRLASRPVRRVDRRTGRTARHAPGDDRLTCRATLCHERTRPGARKRSSGVQPGGQAHAGRSVRAA